MKSFDKKPGILAAVIVLLIPLHSSATVQIIGQLGSVYSIKDVLKNYSANIPAKPQFNIEDYDKARFPIKTSLMTPGIVKAKPVNYMLLNQPFYIIGDDMLSKRWLSLHAERLKEINAVGFIVNVKTLEAVKKIEKHYRLTLIPACGNDYVRNLGIQHYPVLISNQRVEQ